MSDACGGPIQFSPEDKINEDRIKVLEKKIKIYEEALTLIENTATYWISRAEVGPDETDRHGRYRRIASDAIEKAAL